MLRKIFCQIGRMFYELIRKSHPFLAFTMQRGVFINLCVKPCFWAQPHGFLRRPYSPFGSEEGDSKIFSDIYVRFKTEIFICKPKSKIICSRYTNCYVVAITSSHWIEFTHWIGVQCIVISLKPYCITDSTWYHQLHQISKFG